MPNFYSQHGEDYILSEMFKDQKDGFFVEVGCIDGRRFSNTMTFEEQGWRGMCVEAHSGYIELLKKNRPGSIVCHCAAGEKDEDNVTFYANSRGSLSTLDNSQENHFREHYGKFFTGFEEQRVVKRTLTTLFREHHVDRIDILSLDIEGYEVEALMGLDFKQYKPKVLVVESDNTEHEKLLDKLLMAQGYYKSILCSRNIFYLSDKKMEKKIIDKAVCIELIHTGHPLDNDGDACVMTHINTKTDKFFTRLKKIFA